MMTPVLDQPLSSFERSTLKSKAHHLKPVVQIGQSGVTASITKQVRIALRDHELIKVQSPQLDDAQSKNEISENLLTQVQSFEQKDNGQGDDVMSAVLFKGTHLIGRIGRNIILYLNKEAAPEGSYKKILIPRSSVQKSTLQQKKRATIVGALKKKVMRKKDRV